MTFYKIHCLDVHGLDTKQAVYGHALSECNYHVGLCIGHGLTFSLHSIHVQYEVRGFR